MMFLAQGMLSGAGDSTSARSRAEKKWLACRTNADCTEIAVDCGMHWQPVNAKYVSEMQAARAVPCTVSIPPGPQPTAYCVNHSCSAKKRKGHKAQ